jgi:hypothetical protein
MKEERNVPHNDYSVDEILAEAKVQRDRETKAVPKNGVAESKQQRRFTPLNADSIVRSARKALNMEAADEPAAPPEKKPKRKKKRSLFRRQKNEDDSIPEDDIYYGLQLKSLEEYRQDYEETIHLDTQVIRDAEETLRRKKQQEVETAQKGPVSEPPADFEEAQTEPVSESSADFEEVQAESVAEPPADFEEVQAEPVAKPPADFEEAQTEPVAEPPADFEKVQAEPVAEPPADFEKAQAEPAAEPLEKADKAQAMPIVAENADDRQDILEKIMRHTGLNAKDVFGFENDIPKPEPPVNPPRPVSPPTIPPVPPAVEPGPPLEPEQEPPLWEPPLAPESLPTAEAPEGKPDESEPAAIQKETEPQKPEIVQTASETSASEPTEETLPSRTETAENAPPSAVKEPVTVPSAKEETPPPPAAKEPPQRKAPRYRADSLPLHVIELNMFDDALAAEADGYGIPPVHAPEPIPFPKTTQEEEPEPFADRNEKPEAAAAEKPEPEDGGNVRAMPLPEQPSEPRKTKKRFRIFGSEEDPAPPDSPPEEAEEELDDYTAPADAPSVMNDLSSNVRKLFLRFVVTGFFAVILTGFAVAWEHQSLLPPELHNVYTAQNCLITQLIFLAASAVFCAPAIRNGLRGLFRFQANSDSAVAVAVLAAAAENTAFLFTGFPAKCHLYSSLAVLALFLNTAGKLSMSKRILRNFRFLVSSDEKYAVQMFGDYNTAIQMTKTFAAGGPKIAYQTKVGFPSHFLKHSYASDPGEHVSQFLAPAGFLGSLALCIATAVLTKDPAMALAAFTASACVCVPFGGPLSVSLPLARLNRIAARCGGMTVGWDAVERFSDTDAILLDAQDLFPRGTVVLNGIQTFAGQRIDEAILDATALTAAVGGPLSDLFSQIVKARGEVLPHVERPVYEEGLGISGTVSDRVILVGTGALLKHHGVDAPSHDYEEKYLRSGKVPVYLASGGMLVAMFLVFYRSDRRRAAELRRLEFNGISLLVRTRDPNITPDLIADCFGLSRNSVVVLPERLGEVYASLQAHPPERVSAVIATKGRATAMMRLLTACARQRGNISIGVALQTAGAVLGFALAAFFTACSGLGQLSATALLLFEAFWTAAVIFVPKIRRP